jgi:hypothetical protein
MSRTAHIDPVLVVVVLSVAVWVLVAAMVLSSLAPLAGLVEAGRQRPAPDGRLTHATVLAPQAR